MLLHTVLLVARLLCRGGLEATTLCCRNEGQGKGCPGREGQEGGGHLCGQACSSACQSQEVEMEPGGEGGGRGGGSHQV